MIRLLVLSIIICNINARWMENNDRVMRSGLYRRLNLLSDTQL